MFAPFRDRTVTLTLENTLPASNLGNSPIQTQGAFVNKYLPQSGLAGSLVQNAPGLGSVVANLTSQTLTLAGVNHISVSHTVDVGMDTGISTSFLQAWFIKPVAIMLSGQSSLGAYPLVSPIDGDVQNILKKFRTAANDFSGKFGKPGNRSRFLIELFGYPSGAQKFLGYIQKFEWSEEVKAPNILNYNIAFIGFDVDGASLAKGKSGAAADLVTYSGGPSGG